MFQFHKFFKMLGRLAAYRPGSGIRVLAATSRRQLARLSCSASSNKCNGNHVASANHASTRVLPGVTWGLAYHEPSAEANGLDDSSDLERYKSLDAIVVLAGGQTGPDSIPVWVERRLDTALSLQRLQRQPCPILSLGGGTPHKGPYLDTAGFVVHESTACARYLLQRGAAADHLLKEVSSYDTVGNAYFSLTIHAVPAGWRRLAVVTSDFHMPRTAALFASMYGLAGRELYGDPRRFELMFVAATDEGIFEHEVLNIRKSKEDASRAAWLHTAEGLTSLRDLHTWLHGTHLCYSVSRQHEFGVQQITDSKLLASY
ncbi:hypothetical protein PLESTB_001544900 [Pleodorina starrii]|uniref:DUF218 domain-containing protein n=1 Tax=Pleodorina starrii TaxID=330485 RepID=A0A9W6BYI2_9CHLO|nr:hypothetical protein PLESTM_001998300 [Pleodorina starrii]GLC59871.1 hypothetical protein PLESTB_001544900 [Pleodorina starrii]GLC69091.1 hypothetical protein PLESTF_000788100 [Pleodorina starrii]